MPLLEAENVKAFYAVRGGYVRAVDDVSLTLDEGIISGIAGESGCGKSTLANTLMMNVRPPLKLLEGTIALDGQVISRMERSTLKKNIWGVRVSIIPQSSLNALMPTKRIGSLIRDIISHHMYKSDSEILNMARKRFEDLGLATEALNMYSHELSGGMKQRAVIAISTLLNPKLLIVDEPTSALDVSTQKQVLKMLIDLKRAKITEGIIFITHDIAILRQVCDMINIMYAGKIVEYGSAVNILYEPMHPYTKALINSVVTPETEVRKRGLASIPGDPPSLIDPPKGCRFYPRCMERLDICQSTEPQLLEVKDRTVACHVINSKIT